MQRHQRMPSWGFSAGFHQLKLEHWIRCCLECLKVSIRVPQSTAPSSKQSHHFSALLPPIVAAVVLLFDGVRWNLLAANQLKSFSVQRGLRAIFISNWFDSRLVVQSPIYSITSATLSSPLWSAAHQSPERLTKRVSPDIFSLIIMKDEKKLSRRLCHQFYIKIRSSNASQRKTSQCKSRTA